MTKEEAIEKYETKWWEGKDDRQVAIEQLKCPLLTMPFDEFHRCVEKLLGRPVLNSEFSNLEHLLMEAGKPERS